MSFNIRRKTDFTVPVKVQTLLDGKWIDESFSLTCKRLDLGQLEALKAQGDATVLREVVAGWDGLTDDDGNPVEFASETLEGFLLIPSAVRASALAYVTALAGIRQGN